MTIAYIRVFTEDDTGITQRDSITLFAKTKHLSIGRWIIEDGSSRSGGKIENIVKKMNAGDHLIISDILQLDRRQMGVAKFITLCIEQGITFYSVSEGYQFKEDANSNTLSFIFALVSEIESKLVSIRTKEGLAYLRGRGTRLGRPKGSSAKRDRLLPYKDEIAREVQRGRRIKLLAATYQVTPYVLRRFIQEDLYGDNTAGSADTEADADTDTNA